MNRWVEQAPPVEAVQRVVYGRKRRGGCPACTTWDSNYQDAGRQIKGTMNYTVTEMTNRSYMLEINGKAANLQHTSKSRQVFPALVLASWYSPEHTTR
jgi:hypothetical protein